MMEKPNPEILGQTPEELAKLAERLGGKPFHGRQVFRWVNQRGIFDFERMTDLPRGFRKTLQANVSIGLPRVVHSRTAAGTGPPNCFWNMPIDSRPRP